MVSRAVIEIASKCPENLDTWKNLATGAGAAGMTQRDARDLLMEFGCPGVTASELTAGM
jgi:hypothetical protein